MLIQGLNKNCVCIYKNVSNQQKKHIKNAKLKLLMIENTFE